MKRQLFDPSKELNEMKVLMAYLEWYKKNSKDKKTGYYDNYKNGSHTSDFDITKYKRALNNYWVDMVDEAEKKPQKEGASFRTRWLFAGTNYRRMIEPLDIADYYKEGGKDYIKSKRSEHYKKLEQWQNETEKPASGTNNLKKQNVASILTEDSCFWAHLEEARNSCELLRRRESTDREKESAKQNLIEFGNYVYNLMQKYAVSSEIFLPQSSFMQWWSEYKKIMGTSCTSRLSDLMKNYVAHEKLEIP